MNLESCSLLERLFCNNNSLIRLATNQCTSLKELECTNNQLEELILPNNSLLWRLNCTNNNLSSLNVSSYSKLVDLKVGVNNLSSLDISHCPELSIISIANTNISFLDCKQCSKLSSVSCDESEIETLDLSNCTELSFLGIRNTKNLNQLLLANSPITGINAEGSMVLHEIPDWFPTNNPDFQFFYEHRYNYTDKYQTDSNNNKLRIVEDKGYGWWYPDEPGNCIIVPAGNSTDQ